jgi:hypothetical protein
MLIYEQECAFLNAYLQEAFILGSGKASALRNVTNLVFQRVLIGQPRHGDRSSDQPGIMGGKGMFRGGAILS